MTVRPLLIYYFKNYVNDFLAGILGIVRHWQLPS
jgi:hypothetical protein